MGNYSSEYTKNERLEFPDYRMISLLTSHSILVLGVDL